MLRRSDTLYEDSMTAATSGLRVVARKVRDFKTLEVEVLNPFAQALAAVRSKLPARKSWSVPISASPTVVFAPETSLSHVVRTDNLLPIDRVAR